MFYLDFSTILKDLESGLSKLSILLKSRLNLISCLLGLDDIDALEKRLLLFKSKQLFLISSEILNLS
jgi:hypothetical protein